MSGGLIILITVADSATRNNAATHKSAKPFSQSIYKEVAKYRRHGARICNSSMLKVAQGMTVAMIIGSSMVAAMVNIEALPYHAGYLVTSIGGGSLIGSWMNDSGFWVYATSADSPNLSHSKLGPLCPSLLGGFRRCSLAWCLPAFCRLNNTNSNTAGDAENRIVN